MGTIYPFKTRVFSFCAKPNIKAITRLKHFVELQKVH